MAIFAQIQTDSMKRFLCTVLLTAAAFTAMAQVQEEHRYAVVEFSANFMREEPAYEAENGDQSLMGTVVEVVGEKDYWSQIISPEPYKAWVNTMGIVEMSGGQIREYIDSPKYICTADYTHIYSKPDIKSQRISDFVMGGLVRQITDARGRAVRHGRFAGVMLPSGVRGWVLRDEIEDFSSWTESRRFTAENIISTAYKFLGVPYMWGGTSIKSVDCSGLARCVFFMNGILLPRNASQQARTGVDVGMDELQPGDLLFFGRAATAESPERVSHVAIYLGGGRYIHSSQVVRISSLDSGAEDYGGRMPIRARRILGHTDDGTGIVSIAKSPYYFTQSE